MTRQQCLASKFTAGVRALASAYVRVDAERRAVSIAPSIIGRLLPADHPRIRALVIEPEALRVELVAPVGFSIVVRIGQMTVRAEGGELHVEGTLSDDVHMVHGVAIVSGIAEAVSRVLGIDDVHVGGVDLEGRNFNMRRPLPDAGWLAAVLRAVGQGQVVIGVRSHWLDVVLPDAEAARRAATALAKEFLAAAAARAVSDHTPRAGTP